MALVIVLILIPVLGARNIFYLEVIFQIAVFSALALGLNIVVGFSGLLDLGYMAFYAVGAYLWAFFGSQQTFLLKAIPGTAPRRRNSFMAADCFYLFIFLGVVLAARRPDPGPAGPPGARRLPCHHHPGLRRDRSPACQQPGQADQPDQRPAGHHPHPEAYAQIPS